MLSPTRELAAKWMTQSMDSRWKRLSKKALSRMSPLIEPRLGMDCLPVTCFQVIRNHYVSAAVDELVSRVGANVAGPAQY